MITSADTTQPDRDAPPSPQGMALLQVICNDAEDDISQLIHDTPALLSSPIYDGLHPLHFAVHLGVHSAIATLLALGADYSAEDGNGRLPLSYADSVKTVRMLMDAGGDLRVTDLSGNTYLHTAATAEVAAFLVEAGLDINACDYRNRTPLHKAARAGNLDVVNYLIAAGAHLNSIDWRGHTPLDLASEYNHPAVCTQLTRAGARRKDDPQQDPVPAAPVVIAMPPPAQPETDAPALVPAVEGQQLGDHLLQWHQAIKRQHRPETVLPTRRTIMLVVTGACLALLIFAGIRQLFRAGSASLSTYPSVQQRPLVNLKCETFNATLTVDWSFREPTMTENPAIQLVHGDHFDPNTGITSYCKRYQNNQASAIYCVEVTVDSNAKWVTTRKGLNLYASSIFFDILRLPCVTDSERASAPSWLTGHVAHAGPGVVRKVMLEHVLLVFTGSTWTRTLSIFPR